MMNNNKVLTVSYGTFSCTLEGFDDSFGTMTAIAEYFRDLASDDRYFGAEPPQPDAEMLARIAENEIARRVQASLDNGRVVLSAAPEAAQVAAPEPVPDAPAHDPEAPGDVAAAAQVAPKPVAEAEPVSRADAAPVGTITDKLARIRAVVAQKDAEAAYSEDEHAGAFGRHRPMTVFEAFEAEDLAEAEPVVAASMPGPVAAPVERVTDAPNDEDATEANAPIFDTDPVETAQIEAAVTAAAAEGAALEGGAAEFDPATPAEPGAAPDTDPAEAAMPDSDGDAHNAIGTPAQADSERGTQESAQDEAPTDADPAAQDTVEAAAIEDAADAKTPNAADTETPAAATAEVEAEPAAQDDIPPAAAPVIGAHSVDGDVSAILARLSAETAADTPPAADDNRGTDAPEPVTQAGTSAAPARVIKVKRVDLETAIAAGKLQDAAAEPAHKPSSLSEEDEDALLRELAEVEAELDTAAAAELEAVVEDDGEAEAEADIEDPAAADPEATRAPESEAAPSEPSPQPHPETDVDRLMAEADAQMGEPEAARNRDAFAHLKAAVAARKSDKGIADDDPSKAQGRYRTDLAAVVKPRRPAVRSAPRDARPQPKAAPLKLVAEQRVDLPGGDAAGPVRPRRIAAGLQGSGDGSFAEFAEDMGAQTLPHLLEAAAAYLAFVENRESFSRPQVMNKVRSAQEDGFSREDGLRSFGQLLRAGKIVKLKGGRFAATEELNFRPDTRAAG